MATSENRDHSTPTNTTTSRSGLKTVSASKTIAPDTTSTPNVSGGCTSAAPTMAPRRPHAPAGMNQVAAGDGRSDTTATRLSGARATRPASCEGVVRASARNSEQQPDEGTQRQIAHDVRSVHTRGWSGRRHDDQVVDRIQP